MTKSNTTHPSHAFSSATVTVENMGGITQTELSIPPGVTVLTGRNATNRTSFLSAIGSVLGSSTGSLKSDADEGAVTLELDGDTYRRSFTRTADGPSTTGSPYTDDEALVDLGVTLFEGNPARQAIEQGGDLRDVIMRPVDTDEIEARIADLTRERDNLDTQLDRVTDRRAKLPAIERRRSEYEAEIDSIEDELATLREDVAAYEADIDAAEEAADLVDDLQDRRQRLQSLTEQLEVKRAERDALREDLADVESELDATTTDTGDQLAALEDDLDSLRTEKREIEDTIASLTAIVDFNDNLLSEGVDLPEQTTAAGEVTDALAPTSEQEVVCWTCGSQVQKGAIEGRLDDLRTVIEEKRAARDELAERISEIQERRDELEQAESQRTRLEQRYSKTEQNIAACEEEIEELESQHETVRSEVQRLEEQVAETEELRESNLTEKYERISDLEYERGQVQQQLEDLDAEQAEIESLPTEEELREEREELQAQLEQKRTRVADLERTAVEAFNDHMAELLDLLAYENLSRVWIERKAATGHSSGASESVFDLHIVRETESGTGYEDFVDNLSESEREVVGLVVALASYLVHDVEETVPFMLLDSVEAIDAPRIADLVEYFSTHTSFLVIALLPEDAAALSDDYTYIPAEALSD